MTQRLYALHGFLGLPSDWDLLHYPHHSVDLFSIGSSLSTLWAWAHEFNRQVASEKRNILIGYSLGGRLAMHALIDQPHLWQAGIIVSAHPGLSFSHDREKRIQFDAQWAERFLQDPWDQLMDSWNRQPVFNQTTHVVRKESDYSRQHLAHALTRWSLGMQDNLVPLIETLDLPILWVGGGRDPKKCQSPHFKHPLSRTIIFPEAGHRLLFDEPKALSQTLKQFIHEVTECT